MCLSVCVYVYALTFKFFIIPSTPSGTPEDIRECGSRYFLIIIVSFVHYYHHGGWNAVCTFHHVHSYKRYFLGCQLYWYILHWYTHVSSCSRYTIHLGHLLVGAVPNQAMNINVCRLGLLCVIIHCSSIPLGPIGGTE